MKAIGGIILRGAAIGIVFAAGTSCRAETVSYRELEIAVPGKHFDGTRIATVDVDEASGNFEIVGWINPDPMDVKLSMADGVERRAYLDELGPAFGKLRHLLEAYAGSSVEKFLNLHRPEVRSEQAAKLADPGLRKQWEAYVGTIDAITPLMIWRVEDGYGIFLRLHQTTSSGETRSDTLPMRFDDDFRLSARPFTSEMVGNLTLYFADAKSSPSALLR